MASETVALRAPVGPAEAGPVTIGAFVYRTSPQRIVFGSGGRTRLADEARLAGIARALVVSTPEQTSHANEIAAVLGERCALIFAGARMHTPVTVTEAAVALAKEQAVDGIVAIGGGSAIGLAKAIALRTDLTQIVLPTTYAGSEMTDILGQTAEGAKHTMRDARILPEVVIYDVDLTTTLPAEMSVTSGFNAIAHAVEGLYAENTNPFVALMAEEGIRALASALPRIATSLTDAAARSEALYGAWLCGAVLQATSMALHHKLCHVLGGAFDLPHAQTHAVLLPHTLAFNAPAVPEAMARVSRALATPHPAPWLFALLRGSGAPSSLCELGMPAGTLEQAADLALANPYWNPRPLLRSGIRALLEDAWHGRPPGSTTS